MKISPAFLPRLVLVLHLSAMSALAALSGSDNFNDNTKDTTKWGTDAFAGGATLVETNSRLEYRVTTPDSNYDEALRPWVLNTAGSGEAFEVILDVTNTVSPAGGSNASIGLMVTSLENAEDNIYVELCRGGPNTDGNGFLAALSSAAAGGDEVLPYTLPTSHASVTTASVRLSYNPSTKIFTAYYDTTGSADGFQWVAYGSFGVGASGGGDMRNSPWQLTQNLGFKIAVEAVSEGLVVAGGTVYADNFSVASMASHTDNFNDNSKDPTKWGTDLSSGNASFLETNSRLEYRVTSPSGDYDEALRPWILNTPNSTDGFEVILDVFNNVTPTGSNNASIGLMVTSLENAEDKIYVELYRSGPNTDGKGFLAALSSAAAGGDEVLPYTLPTSHSSVTTASVRLSYNPSTQIFTAYYDTTGSADGFQWVAYGSFGVGASGGGDMRNSPWQLTQNLGFKIAVEAFSEGQVVASGAMYADNFQVNPASLPVVTLSEPAGLTATTVTLNGSVNPNGSATTARFEYGLTMDYGGTVDVTLSPDDGTTAQTVSVTLSALQSGAVYHYRLSATNSGGTTTSYATLTTPAVPQKYAWMNFAGEPGESGRSDGIGSAAHFWGPQGITTDGAGNVYVADSDNHTIRKISGSGVVTTLAGSPGLTGSADGASSTARFFHPAGVAADGGGNVYVTDSNNQTIRKISSSGVVTTLAGSPGISGSMDGTGSAARFANPAGVAVDNGGNVYVADSLNHTIRKISSSGVVTTLAGSAGSDGSTDGSGSAARFYTPCGVAVDASGNVYVADTSNSTIRKITSSGLVTTLAGSPTMSDSTDGTSSTARFNLPSSVAVDSAGNIYVADTNNHTIRKITSGGLVTTIGGSVGTTGSANGILGDARFFFPYGVAADGSGNIYMTDTVNNRISIGLIGAPAATLAASDGLTTTTATLNGAVNPNGSATTAQFEYGTTTSYGSTKSVTLTPDNGTTMQTVSGAVSGLQPGTLYHYRLSATNGVRASITSSGTFTTPTLQQHWRQTYFGTIENAGNAADAHDFDKDGIPNLIEYAMNLNPTAPSMLPATHRHNGSSFEYTYTRSIAAMNAGTGFAVEWSDTLPGPIPWSTTGVTEQILSSNGTVQQVKVTIPTGGSMRRFVRLKITGPGN